jgi:Ca-activated chloride channel family protein
MLRALLIALATCLAGPALACQTALMLAVDVSGSIDPDEYLLQTSGLADALLDPEIAQALVAGQVALAVMHWSGVGYQQLSLPWASMHTLSDVTRFARAVRDVHRPLTYSDTSIGGAIRFSLAQFAAVPDCRDRVIDISGDGEENAGLALPAARAESRATGVTINAIAIEVDATATALSAYFNRFVITPDGFVVTAKGVTDYPRAIRTKLQREVIKPAS